MKTKALLNNLINSYSALETKQENGTITMDEAARMDDIKNVIEKLMSL